MLRKEIRTEGLWLWSGWWRPTKRLLRQWVGFRSRDWDGNKRKISRLGFYTLTIYDALVCLTACYPKKFGPRGIGHAGVMWIGLQCDIEDEGYAPPIVMLFHYQLLHLSMCVCVSVRLTAQFSGCTVFLSTNSHAKCSFPNSSFKWRKFKFFFAYNE